MRSIWSEQQQKLCQYFAIFIEPYNNECSIFVYGILCPFCAMRSSLYGYTHLPRFHKYGLAMRPKTKYIYTYIYAIYYKHTEKSIFTIESSVCTVHCTVPTTYLRQSCVSNQNDKVLVLWFNCVWPVDCGCG